MCTCLSDIRLNAGHAAVEAWPVAPGARGPRSCHVAHWLSGGWRDHVRHHCGLLRRVKHLLVNNMAAVLVDMVVAVVTKGERQGH